MGVCQPQTRKAEFTARFSANLKQLFEYYKKLLEYLKPSKLFSQPSQELNVLVQTYLANPKILDKQKLDLCSIDSVHKLHPIDYGTSKVTKQWLIDACLRQDKFIQDFPYEKLKFQQCYRHYVEFLYLCSKNPQSVIVPNKFADFMWHSHMQDNDKYKEDSKTMLKKVLNHTDDFTEEQMKLYAQETEKTRKRLLRQPLKTNSSSPNNNSSSQSYHNFAFINYGPGICGGGYYPPIDNHDTHPYHPQHKDTHPHHPDHNTHPHHNDYNHHDTGHSNHHDTGHNTNDTGGHHSACGGGGHSSCGGGGASSCGGGGSSCGGGGSSCGGGGSSCGGGGGGD